MARIVKCGLIQASCDWETPKYTMQQIKKNMIEKHVDMIESAAKKGVQMIGLQEIFYGPYFCAEQDTKWYDTAEPIDGPTTKLMQKLAKKHKMVIVSPIYETPSTGTYYNTAAVIDADGSLAGIYRKNHIPHCAPGFWEKFYFKPGNLGYPVFQTRYAKVGVYICYDRHFPDGARILGLNGAEIVFNPSATVKGLSQYLWKLEQPAHAVANQYFVGASNRVGTEGPWKMGEFYGQSYFCDPRGQMLAVGSNNKSELVTANLDFDQILEVRKVWQFFRDRRPETYGELVQQLPVISVLRDEELHDHSEPIKKSPYWNKDIAPVGAASRTWATKDFAVLWISMSACIPTYMLASSLIAEGMNWWEAVLTIFLGNCIVLAPMVLNAHAGTKYGIPYPVYCRPSFGILGANVPAVLRALVACGWFGIQTWIGGAAIYKLLGIFSPALVGAPPLFEGLNGAQWGCFLFFWAINMFVIYKGVESIRILLNVKAPLLILLGLALLAWAYVQAGGFGLMLSTPSAFEPGQPKAGQFWPFFFPALTAMIGFWATLSLNIPDFSRYAKSQKDQMWGQALGLPLTMGLYSFIGVAVTSATVVIYGKTIWDPVELIAHFKNPVVLTIALLSLVLATLATNIAANVVGPANDFAHLWPEKIDFRMGGYITGIIGILIQPWKLIADPSGYIFKWLVAYSSLLGSVGGILIADYFLIRRGKLDVRELYEKNGSYWYVGGVNGVAMIALVLGVAPVIPGFLGTVGLAHVEPFWISLYNYAWFISFGISFASYRVFMKWGENS